MNKVFILLFMISFFLINSEILILEKTKNGFIVPEVSANTEKMIADIVKKYQWPQCLTEKLTPAEIDELFSPNIPFAEVAFITKKLQVVNAHYYAFFIPTSLYELVCLINFFTIKQPLDLFLNRTSRKKLNISQNLGIALLFDTNSSGDLKAASQNAWNDILQNKITVQSYTKAMDSIYQKYRYINNLVYKENGAFWEINSMIAKNLFLLFPKLGTILDENKFAFKLAEKSEDFLTFLSTVLTKVLPEWKKVNNSVDIPSINKNLKMAYMDLEELSEADKHNLLMQVINLEFKAAQNNKALLLRGTDTFIPKTFNNLPMPLVASTVQQEKSHYLPYSVSFGNSLFAGIVSDISACSYLYFNASSNKEHILGYGLFINKKDYITNQCNNLLFIAPFSTFAGLYSTGEFFHSRSKAATLSKKAPGVKVLGIKTTYKIEDPLGVILITRNPVLHERLFAELIHDNLVPITDSKTDGSVVIENQELYKNIYTALNTIQRNIRPKKPRS